MRIWHKSCQQHWLIWYQCEFTLVTQCLAFGIKIFISAKALRYLNYRLLSCFSFRLSFFSNGKNDSSRFYSQISRSLAILSNFLKVGWEHAPVPSSDNRVTVKKVRLTLRLHSSFLNVSLYGNQFQYILWAVSAVVLIALVMRVQQLISDPFIIKIIVFRDNFVKSMWWWTPYPSCCNSFKNFLTYLTALI